MDPISGAKRSLFDTHGWNRSVAFGHGERWLAAAATHGAVGSYQGTVVAWDLEADAEVWRIDAPGPVYALAFHPSEPLLAGACDDGRIYLWELRSGEQRSQGHDAADRACLARAGMRHAQVQRVVEARRDLAIGVDDERRVDRLGADADVVEVAFMEYVEIFLELGDHDRDQVTVLIVGKEFSQLLQPLLRASQ